MIWFERLKRVFKIEIDVDVCSECGCNVKIIASIKDLLVIDLILTNLDLVDNVIPQAFQLPEAQWPPAEVFL
ncbi:MAG: hypothetical protein HRU20_10775 [Pseudomonadales bacterium]|nr:hypothetical protein [Pseudomonadales bacterium]